MQNIFKLKMNNFATTLKERIILIMGFSIQILFYIMKNYSFFKNHDELLKCLILPIIFIFDAFYSEMFFNRNIRRFSVPMRVSNNFSYEYHPNNRTEDEIRPINLNARRRSQSEANESDFNNEYEVYN